MQEIRKLKMSFDQWKETFKTRMRDTYTFVKKSNVSREARRQVSARHQMYQQHSSARHHSHHDQPPSPASEDGIPSPNDNYMQKMKDGFMGATSTATTAMKGMVGKIQRRMSQHPPERGMGGTGSGSLRGPPSSGGPVYTAADAYQGAYQGRTSSGRERSSGGAKPPEKGQ